MLENSVLHEHYRLNRLNLLIIELLEVSQGKFHKNNRKNLGVKHRTSKEQQKSKITFFVYDKTIVHLNSLILFSSTPIRSRFAEKNISNHQLDHMTVMYT